MHQEGLEKQDPVEERLMELLFFGVGVALGAVTTLSIWMIICDIREMRNGRRKACAVVSDGDDPGSDRAGDTV